MLKQIPEYKFIEFKQELYNQCRILPYQNISLILTTVTAGTDFDSFVGDSARATAEYPVYCLFKQELSPRDRTKYGISADTEMVVWIPPQEIEQYAQFSGFTIDAQKTKVKFSDMQYSSGTIYEIDKVQYKGRMYNSCICVELHLVHKKSQSE